MFKRSLIALTALGLIAGTAGVTVAGADSSSDTSALLNATAVAATTPTEVGSVLAAPVATVDPAAVKAFKVFKDQPASPMPADVAAGVGSSQKYGRNPNLARAINTPKGKGWVVPGRGYVCLAVPIDDGGYVTNCQATQVAATNGLQIGVGSKDPQSNMTVTTVAPVNSDVVAVAPNGTTTDVPSNSNDVSTTTVPPTTNVEVTAP